MFCWKVCAIPVLWCYTPLKSNHYKCASTHWQNYIWCSKISTLFPPPVICYVHCQACFPVQYLTCSPDIRSWDKTQESFHSVSVLFAVAVEEQLLSPPLADRATAAVTTSLLVLLSFLTSNLPHGHSLISHLYLNHNFMHNVWFMRQMRLVTVSSSISLSDSMMKMKERPMFCSLMVLLEHIWRGFDLPTKTLMKNR